MAKYKLLYEREFLENIPDDYDRAIVAIIEPFFDFVDSTRHNFNTEESYKAASEFRTVLDAFFESRDINKNVPNVTNDAHSIDSIIKYALSLQSTSKEKIDIQEQEANKHEYLKIFKKEPVYVFTDSEFKKIQKLMNELRNLISNSELISAEHKRRLLRRLEAMQAELHKKTSDIDRFWGFIAEAGICARKFGEDMKPITERVETLGRIVIGVVMSHEGIKALPDIIKLLEHTK
jgi:hypothetical protein